MSTEASTLLYTVQCYNHQTISSQNNPVVLFIEQFLFVLFQQSPIDSTNEINEQDVMNCILTSKDIDG